MQVKKFGHAGRTKYTHLKDQDTSTQDSAWAQQSALRSKYTEKMGGMGNQLEKPKPKVKAGKKDLSMY